MTDAPERIWAWKWHSKLTDQGQWQTSKSSASVEYVRADLVPSWQDISTAPKDGTWFVICRAGEPDFYEVGKYDPMEMTKFNERPDGLFEATKEVVFEWRGFDNMHRATHWMPLPPAPEAAQ